MKTDRMLRLAPDPVSAVLCAIGALAAVASIAAVNWVVEDEETDRPRNKRNPRSVLRELEHNCLALRDVLRRMDRNLQLFSSDRGSVATPIKFGVHAIQVPQGSSKLHQGVVTEIAALFDAASRNTFEVMALISETALEPEEDVYFRFGEAQARLNALLIDRTGLRETLAEAAGIAEELAGLVQALRPAIALDTGS
ncbi:MAG: hypothetical protein AAFZ01_14725 [Pseudomonadota bacterium]